jgi:alpha-tubulin suppressor-like RCC1 family protein
VTVGIAGVVAAGEYHACALVGGGVQCWGWNGFGQLGNNSTTESNAPVAVLGLGSGVQALAAGSAHTCALVNGGVQCWGDNSNGQLGNNSTNESNVPVAVQGLGSGVQAIAAGSSHTCALVGGGVQCWGSNSNGQLGDGSTTDSPVPVAVQGLGSPGSGVQALVGGYAHTCALVNGGVQCWGSNSNGQLGDNSTTDSATPVAVQGLGGGAQAIAAGDYHTCALAAGGVQCWGYNADGQLGNNSTTDSPIPVGVQGLASGVEAVAAGFSHSCAVVGGGAQCWGDNSFGDLGNNSTSESNVPVGVQGLGGGVLALSLGASHTCALVNGGVQCWGWDSYGQLGNGSTAESDVAVPVQGLGSGVEAVAAGNYHTCALVNGGAQCWGDNAYGDLGNNSSVGSDEPVAVTGLGNGVQALTGGDFHTCALVGGGALCWGWNVLGQLGNGSTNASNVPVAVQGLGSPSSGVQALTGGDTHTCALVNGGVQCWGDDSFGQLGNGSVSDAGVDTPVGVLGLTTPGSGVQAIAAGDYHTCALVNGGVQCWGDNANGDLGNGSTTESPVPVSVQGLGPGSGVQAIASGSNHTCALVNGGVQCWGQNLDGELGDFGSLDSDVPVAVQGLGSPGSGVQAIAAGTSHSCALVNGGVQCWGANGEGQLGDGSILGSNVPVGVQGLGSPGSGVQAIAAFGYHTCALVSGEVFCWGDNAAGDVGDGSSIQRDAPVPVGAWAQ